MHYTRSVRSVFCRYRLRFRKPRRFLSGPENIVLLLSMSYVANWERRMRAKHFAEVCALSSKELHLLAWAPSLLHVAWYNCDCRFQLIRRPICGPNLGQLGKRTWF